MACGYCDVDFLHLRLYALHESKHILTGHLNTAPTSRMNRTPAEEGEAGEVMGREMTTGLARSLLLIELKRSHQKGYEMSRGFFCAVAKLKGCFQKLASKWGQATTCSRSQEACAPVF